MLVYLAKGTLPWIEQVSETNGNKANEMPSDAVIAKCLAIK